MQLVRVPAGSGWCGQACVAMAAGVSLEQGHEAVGHRRKTETKDVRRGLRKLGVQCADRARRPRRVDGMPVLPPRAMVSIYQRLPDGWGKGHWLLHWDGAMLDPEDAWPDFYRTWHITSFLEIHT